MEKLANLDSQIWQTVFSYTSQFPDKTQDKYATALREWMRFLGSDAAKIGSGMIFANASMHQAIKYVKWQEQQPGRSGLRSEGMIRKNIDCIKRTYKILMDSGVVRRTPFALVRNVVVTRCEFRQKILPYDKVFELITSPDCSKIQGLRDRALLGLLFGGALRPCEIVKLNVADLRSHGNNYFLWLEKTKNGQSYEQAIPLWAAEFTLEYLEKRKQLNIDSEALFTAFPNGRVLRKMTTKTVRLIFKKYAKTLGFGDNYSAYSGRATAISKLIYDKVALRDVQLFARHSSLELLSIYDRRIRNLEESVAYALNY